MTTVSIGVQDLRMRIGEKAKADPQHRFWGLYTHVWKLEVLREAYQLAKSRKKVLVLEAKGKIAAGETEYTTAHLTSVLDDRFSRLKSIRGAANAKLADDHRIRSRSDGRRGRLGGCERLSGRGGDCG